MKCSIPLTAFAALLAGLFWSSAPADGQERGEAKPRLWEKGDRERVEAWESLSDEQRERLREALREVWTDPAVVTAREEVKHAGDAYQAAVKSAMERVDPSVAELLAKVQGSGGRSPERGGAFPPGGPGNSGGPGPGGPGGQGGGMMRGFDELFKPPGFLESLSSETRERFRKAEEEALKSEAVKQARGDLTKVRDEDDALRRKRIEAHRRLRKAILEEMVRIDPGLVETQKRLLEGNRANAADKKGQEKKREKEGPVGEPGKEGQAPKVPGKADEPAPSIQ